MPKRKRNSLAPLRYNLRHAPKHARKPAKQGDCKIECVPRKRRQAEITLTPESQYQHKPLDLSKAQFRLLRIFKSEHQHVSCSLEICSVKEYEYVALSYTWGAKVPTYPIEIDGKEFRVCENLWWFLSLVASGRLPYHSNADTGTSCYIWIDQICIHQSSIKKKNHQVGLMSDIYRGASEVVGWMGRETEKSSDCMKFLEQAADVFQAQLRDPQFEVLDPHLRFNLRFRNALDVLCRQPYWGRVWIIQEFTMARRIKLRWGYMSLCVDKLRLSKILFEVAHADQSDHVLYRLCKLRREMSTAGRHGLDMSFMGLCLQFGDFACTNPRETFYALLGFVNPEQRIAIDYNRRKQEVFWDAVNVQSLKRRPGHTFPWMIRSRLILPMDRLKITGREAGASRKRALKNMYEICGAGANTALSAVEACQNIHSAFLSETRSRPKRSCVCGWLELEASVNSVQGKINCYGDIRTHSCKLQRGR